MAQYTPDLTSGTILDDFTLRINADANQSISIQGSPEELLVDKTFSANVAAYSYDPAGQPTDFDIVVKTRRNSASGVGFYCGIAGRVSGSTPSNVNMYSLARTGADDVRTDEWVNGSFGTLSNGFNAAVDDQTPIWQRLRVNGTTVQAKAWYGEPADEPGTWALFNGGSSTVSAAGYVCLWVSNTANDGIYEYIGIGTDGDVAPMPADVTAPVLSSPTGSATGATTADGGATTDEGNGTLYWVASQSATKPSATQMKDGQNHTEAPVPSGNQSVSATGDQDVIITGLSAGITYYAHYLHTDSSDNDSNIVTSSSFTTSASPPVISTNPSTVVRTGTGYTITGTNFGASQGLSGKVELEDNSGATTVEQTVTAWSNTSITFSAVAGALTMGLSNNIIRVTNNGGSSDTVTGITVRHPRVSGSAEDDAGAAITSASMGWYVYPTDGAAADDNGTDSTDGAGNLSLTLPNTDAAPGDTVTVVLRRVSDSKLSIDERVIS